MATSKTVSPREAAIRLGCTLKWIYDMLYAEKLPATKIEGRWAIPVSAIAQYSRKRQHQPVIPSQTTTQAGEDRISNQVMSCAGVEK